MSVAQKQIRNILAPTVVYANGLAPNGDVCFVLENRTWYMAGSIPAGLSVDNQYVLASADPTVYWVGFSGQFVANSISVAFNLTINGDRLEVNADGDAAIRLNNPTGGPGYTEFSLANNGVDRYGHRLSDNGNYGLYDYALDDDRIKLYSNLTEILAADGSSIIYSEGDGGYIIINAGGYDINTQISTLNRSSAVRVNSNNDPNLEFIQFFMPIDSTSVGTGGVRLVAGISVSFDSWFGGDVNLDGGQLIAQDATNESYFRPDGMEFYGDSFNSGIWFYYSVANQRWVWENYAGTVMAIGDNRVIDMPGGTVISNDSVHRTGITEVSRRRVTANFNPVIATSDFDPIAHLTDRGTIKYILQLDDGTSLRSSEIMVSYIGSTFTWQEYALSELGPSITGASWEVVTLAGNIAIRLNVTSGTYSVRIVRERIIL